MCDNWSKNRHQTWLPSNFYSVPIMYCLPSIKNVTHHQQRYPPTTAMSIIDSNTPNKHRQRQPPGQLRTHQTSTAPSTAKSIIENKIPRRLPRYRNQPHVPEAQEEEESNKLDGASTALAHELLAALFSRNTASSQGLFANCLEVHYPSDGLYVNFSAFKSPCIDYSQLFGSYGPSNEALASLIRRQRQNTMKGISWKIYWKRNSKWSSKSPITCQVIQYKTMTNPVLTPHGTWSESTISKRTSRRSARRKWKSLAFTKRIDSHSALRAHNYAHSASATTLLLSEFWYQNLINALNFHFSFVTGQNIPQHDWVSNQNSLWKHLSYFSRV